MKPMAENHCQSALVHVLGYLCLDLMLTCLIYGHLCHASMQLATRMPLVLRTLARAELGALNLCAFSLLLPGKLTWTQASGSLQESMGARSQFCPTQAAALVFSSHLATIKQLYIYMHE